MKQPIYRIMWILGGLVVFLIYVRGKCHGHVVLKTLKEKSIECASTSELTFKFISRKTNKSLTIAECDLMMKSCRILERVLESKYNLTYTGRGGILHINRLDEETIGIYECCETYNPSNYVSTEILTPYCVISNDYPVDDVPRDATHKTTEFVPVEAIHNYTGDVSVEPDINTGNDCGASRTINTPCLISTIVAAISTLVCVCLMSVMVKRKVSCHVSTERMKAHHYLNCTEIQCTDRTMAAFTDNSTHILDNEIETIPRQVRQMEKGLDSVQESMATTNNTIGEQELVKHLKDAEQALINFKQAQGRLSQECTRTTDENNGSPTR